MIAIEQLCVGLRDLEATGSDDSLSLEAFS